MPVHTGAIRTAGFLVKGLRVPVAGARGRRGNGVALRIEQALEGGQALR
ncbi:hypothetical protein [Candidatus Thiodictyon syntrophicum]|nr:hypothetical protein [Candidatus Thiodictyon syntrophicum]